MKTVVNKNTSKCEILWVSHALNVNPKTTIGKRISGNTNVSDAENVQPYEVGLQCMDLAYRLDIGLLPCIF